MRRSVSTPDAHLRDDCWNQIGVQGDKSCPQLVAHIHCKNCPVYGAAASELLDRELPPDYQSAWTVEFARKVERSMEDLSSILIFRLGCEWLALPTNTLEEVLALRTVHSLPHRQNGVVLGVVNVRGELLVSVALERVLWTERADPATSPPSRTAEARMLVLSHEGSRFVARVDEVHGIQRVARGELLPPPATLAKSTVAYTSGIFPWQSRSVGCLDAHLLFRTLAQSLS